MKKILTVLFMALAANIQAQTLRNVFTQMPDSIVPLLSSVNRQDGLDYVDNNMSLDVTNRLGNITTISGEKDRYIEVNTASKAWTRLLLLPSTQGDILLCLVKTVSIDKAFDSSIQFYDTKWNPKKIADYVDLPVVSDFIAWNDSVSEEERTELLKKIDITLMEISANYEKTQDDQDASAPTLTFRLHSLSYMNEEDRKLLAPYLKDSIKMRWNGVKFEEQPSGMDS